MEQAIKVSKEQTGSGMLCGVQREDALKVTLAGLAEARQASVSAETLNLYAFNLSKFELSDVRDVVRRIAMRPRAEGETAFPELGAIMGEVQVLDRRHREQARQARQQREEIAEFWRNLPFLLERTGETEEQFLKRWPSMRGTKPTGENERHSGPSVVTMPALRDRKMAAAGDDGHEAA
jgi:hypothetical protein